MIPLAILSELADILSIIGFPIAIVGIVIAIREAKKARSASEAAQSAVNEFRKDLTQLNVIEQFSKALVALENLKRFIRSNLHHLVPERLAEIRQNLIFIREYQTGLSEPQQQIFQRAITTLKILEDGFDRNLANGTAPEGIAKILSRISTHADELHATVIQIRKQIEEASNE